MGERTNEHRPGEGCYYLLCGISERDGYSVLTLAHKTGIVLARYDESRASEYYERPREIGATVYAKLMPQESEDADYAVVNIVPGDRARCPYGEADFAVRVKRTGRGDAPTYDRTDTVTPTEEAPGQEHASAATAAEEEQRTEKRPTERGAEEMQNGERHRRNILSDIPMDGKLTLPLLLLGRVEKQGAKGPYFDVTVSDKSSVVTAKDFSGYTADIGTGEVFEASVLHNSFGYNISSVAKHVPDISPSDFVRHPPLREEDMYAGILDRLSRLAAEDGATVAHIGVAIYEEHRDELLRWSAAKGMHHNHCGGLLFHVYRMMSAAEGMLCAYSSLDPELLLTAVALHDIGKLVELDTDEMGSAAYTVEGQLLGHLAIGEDMVASVGARLGIEGEKLLLLRHCLAAHHGVPEYGTIATPAILEAFVLYTLDLCDSRVFMYEQAYAALEPGTMAEKKDYGLGVAPYRPRFTAANTYLDDYTDR